jgi:hypothetical protein
MYELDACGASLSLDMMDKIVFGMMFKAGLPKKYYQIKSHSLQRHFFEKNLGQTLTDEGETRTGFTWRVDSSLPLDSIFFYTLGTDSPSGIITNLYPHCPREHK